jgi:hypothetical protein
MWVLGNSRVVIEFALARQTALRAMVKTANFSKFPNWAIWSAKVFVSGIFTPHKERAEIELTELGELKIVADSRPTLGVRLRLENALPGSVFSCARVLFAPKEGLHPKRNFLQS